MRTVDIDDFAVGTGHQPRVMGVLNMSVESNWEPNVASASADAATLAQETLIDNGADIVDIGLQSANPKNDWQPVAVELDRLAKALEVIDRIGHDAAAFSIETRYSEVADRALAGGFDLVNDVCGFADPELPAVCQEHDAPVVKMASPPSIKQPGHLKTIDDVFEALERGGFTEKTILDPAFGGWYDGRTYEDNWEMFRRLREFRAFGRPLLTATNREDFLGTLAGKLENEKQLFVSLAAATLEVDRGVDIIRTHDVPETVDVVAVAHELRSERIEADDPRIVELQQLSRRELERFESRAGVEDGTISGAAQYCFQLEELTDETRKELRQSVSETDATVLSLGESDVLVGDHDALRAAVESLESATHVPKSLVGTVRRALIR
ncbi:dihydropteroate synthase [Halocatena halophila]|uniref:dihydropteroate synthase n=1 Tax=Halocatena halophila TaxID=2814576 RepID=UPI002ED28730